MLEHNTRCTRRHLLKSCATTITSAAVAGWSSHSHATGTAVFASADDDWPWWRGPSWNNCAVGDVPPLQWSPSKNVIWRFRVPGQGHATPCIFGDRIFLATANEEKEIQSLVCCDRASGRELWHTAAHRGGFMNKHKKNSHASATPACDGERVFTVFFRDEAIWVTAFDFNGKIVWQKKVGAYSERYGYGSSPTILGKSLIVAADSKADGFLVALDCESGDEIWRAARPKMASYGPPIVASFKDGRQIIVQGNRVAGYEPQTGRELWNCQAPARATACTLCFDDQRVYSTGGYPERGLYSISTDGAGDVTESHIKWRHERRSATAYVPSPVLADGRLYVVSDGGTATCFRADDGHVFWTERLGGDCSASPVLIGEYVIAPNEAGKTYVFKASDQYQPIAENDMEEGIMASPVVCSGRLYLRTIGHLYCIGTRT